MSRIVSLLLLLTMLLPSMLILTACGGGEEPPTEPPQPPENQPPSLYLPTAGSFEGHATEKFETFVYSPQSADADALIATLLDAAEKILAPQTDYATALAIADAVEEKFAAYTEMTSFARICYSKNAEDAYFAAEYKRLYEASPSVCFAMERFFSAVATSEHSTELAKTNYFASDLVARYGAGAVYTEETLPLFEEEVALLLEAQTISKDTVSITFNGMTDTLTNILAQLAMLYGKDSPAYQQAATRCQTIYAKTVNQKRADLYLSLLRTRREIADTLGYESYAELAAQRLGYDAQVTDMEATLDDIEDFILPLYRALSADGYFTANTGKVEKIAYPETMLNTLTSFYESKGGKLFEGYNYLLNKGLFSLGAATGTRASGSYSVLLESRLQAFLFVSTEGSAADYISVASALGDALYYYQNGTENTALSTEMRKTEISDAIGAALRLLTLEGMEETLSKTESSIEISSYLVLLKQEIYTALRTVLTQSMRTAIELEAYALAADEITAEAVNAIVADAAARFECFELQDGAVSNLSISTENLLSHDMLHTPMQAFADLSSAYIALSVFLLEKESDGAGFAALELLLAQDASNGNFGSVLSALSLPHPADAQTLTSLATALYEALTGYSYGGAPTAPPTLT